MKKTRLLFVLLVAIVALTGCGSSSTSNSSGSTDGGSTTSSDAFVMGNELLGTLSLDGDWELLPDASVEDEMLRYYNNDDDSILDLGVNRIAGEDYSMEDLITFHNDYYSDPGSYEDTTITLSEGTFREYPATIMSGSYVDPSMQELFLLNVWFFEDESGQIRYIALEALPEVMPNLMKAVEENYSIAVG